MKFKNIILKLSLRQTFSAQKGQFTSLLIGKDGTIKLRQRDRLNLVDILSEIDRMLMRQQELRKGVE